MAKRKKSAGERATTTVMPWSNFSTMLRPTTTCPRGFQRRHSHKNRRRDYPRKRSLQPRGHGEAPERVTCEARSVQGDQGLQRGADRGNGIHDLGERLVQKGLHYLAQGDYEEEEAQDYSHLEKSPDVARLVCWLGGQDLLAVEYSSGHVPNLGSSCEEDGNSGRCKPFSQQLHLVSCCPDW